MAVIFLQKQPTFIAELSRAKRASGAPWVRKWSNLPIRENLVITWPYARPSVRTTGIPMWNNSINRYGNPNATRGCFGGKSHSHLRLLKQRPGGAGNGLWSCRFSAFHDRPSWEICQSFENCSEHASNGLGTTTTSRTSSSQRFDSAKWICFWSRWSLLSLL